MKRTDWILLAALIVVSSAWCLTASRQIGATFDEPFYLQGGIDYWRHGHFGTLLAARHDAACAALADAAGLPR